VKTWNVPLTIHPGQDCPTLTEVEVNPDQVTNQCPAHTAEVEITGQVTNHDPSLLSTLTVEIFTAGDGLGDGLRDDLVDDLVDSDPHVAIAPDGSFSASFAGLAAGSYYASVGAPEVGEPGGTAFDVHTHDCPEFTSLAFHPDAVGNDCPATNAHAALHGHITHHDPSPSSTVGVELFKEGSTQALGETTQVEVDERGKFIHHIGGLEQGRYTATATITHSGEPIDKAHATVDVAIDDCPPTSAASPASTPSEPSQPPCTPEPTAPTDPLPGALFTSIEVDTLPVGGDEELAQTGASGGGLVLLGLSLGGAGLLLSRRARRL